MIRHCKCRFRLETCYFRFHFRLELSPVTRFVHVAWNVSSQSRSHSNNWTRNLFTKHSRPTLCDIDAVASAPGVFSGELWVFNAYGRCGARSTDIKLHCVLFDPVLRIPSGTFKISPPERPEQSATWTLVRQSDSKGKLDFQQCVTQDKSLLWLKYYLMRGWQSCHIAASRCLGLFMVILRTKSRQCLVLTPIVILLCTTRSTADAWLPFAWKLARILSNYNYAYQPFGRQRIRLKFGQPV